LAILIQNETYVLYFLPPPCPKTVPAPLKGDDIYRRYTQNQHLKIEYCSQHNVLHYECYHCQTKFFSPSYLLFLMFSYRQTSEFVLKQEFKPK